MAVLISLVRLASSPWTGRVPTFFGVAVQALVTDGAHDVGLMTLLIEGIAHGLAVDGETFILCAIHFVPAPKSAVQMCRIDTDQHIAQDKLAWHVVVALFPTEPKRSRAWGPKLSAQSEMAR